MSVLLIRLAAPLQSWGSKSRFSIRGTESQPTKSGVIGMLTAALGMPRTASLARFDGLRFGVRADQPGVLLDDFQTAHNDDGDSMPLSHRHYLADAVFLAGLEDASEHGHDRLSAYADALRAPYYPLYLGRRSCPPDGPVRAWVVDDTLENALRTTPWQATARHQAWSLRTARRFPQRLEAEILVEPNGSRQDFDVVMLNDAPKSFDPRHREWAPRAMARLGTVRPEPTIPADGRPTPSAAPKTAGHRQYRDTDFPADSHDPMAAIMSAPVGPEDVTDTAATTAQEGAS